MSSGNGLGGHNGDPLNEECDQLAQAEAGRQKQTATAL